MRIRWLAVIWFFLAAFTIGALLGRQWEGALADITLSLVSLCAAIVVILTIADGLRQGIASRLSGHNAIQLGRHLALLRVNENWGLRVQNLGQIESLDLTLGKSREQKQISARLLTLFLAIGLILVIAGQSALLRIEPWFAHFDFATQFNFLFRLDTPNLDNTLLGIFLLGVGGVFVGLGVSGLFTDPDFSNRRIALPDLKSRAWSRLLPLGGVGIALFFLLLWRMSEHDPNNVWALVWLLVLGLAGALVYVIGRRANTSLSPSLAWLDLALIGLLLILGLGIGTWQLEQVPNLFIGDEGTFWDTAKSIAAWDYRPSIFDLGVYTYPVLGSFYQALILKLFGLSVWSWRFASVLAGVAAVVPTYLLTREMFNRSMALIAGAVMVVTPYFIAFERLGYNNSQALLPLTLAMYFLYAGLRRSSTFYLYLGGVAAGFGFYTYTAGRLAIILAALFFAYLLVARWAQKQLVSSRWLVMLGIVFVAGWALTTLPHLTFANAVNPDAARLKTVEGLFPNDIYANDFFRGEDLFRDYPPIQIGPFTLFYRADLIARLLVRGFLRTFLAFQYDRFVNDHFVAGPLAGYAGAIFYFLGLAVALANFRKKNFALLGIWFVSGLVLLGVISTFPPRQAHLVAVIPALAILIAVGIFTLIEFVAARLPDWRYPITGLVAATCLAIIAVAGVDNYFNAVPKKYKPNFENVMNFALIELTTPRQMIYVYSDPSEKDFRPWVARTVPNPGKFSAASIEDLEQNRLQIQAGNSYTFFFKEPAHQATLDFLQHTLSDVPDPISYTNPENQILLWSCAFDVGN
jgi:4-amino-4-deoxy-L-arabinose transferase-like glycosyltransferase